MSIKYPCDSKSQTLRMRYPFQSTGRPISHRNVWLFRVYMILLRVFVPEQNSLPGKTTGVNSRRGDSRRHNILWWYHVNKCRTMRGNRKELASGWKSSRCHVNTPPPTYRVADIPEQNCYSSKVKNVFWLDENGPPAMCQDKLSNFQLVFCFCFSLEPVINCKFCFLVPR